MNREIEQLLQLEKNIGTNYVEQSLGYYPSCNNYNLTETEFLMIRMLVSNGQSLIQSHLYNGTAPTELESLLCQYLDAAIEKLPKEDTTEIVFRVTSNSFFSPQDVGKEVVIPAYLTASKKLLSTNDNCVYVIRLSGRTKAKSLYKAYEVMPQLPEEQVEFPRNTRFYVEDVCSKGGKTIVELWEQPDNKWPAEQLANNVSDFFKDIKTIDIHDAVRKGLNPRIHFMSTLSGKAINARCTEKGVVYISPTFAQALWNISYVGLWLSDNSVITDELEKEGRTFDEVCADIDNEKCNVPECLYLKAIHDAYCWEDMLYQMISLLINQYTNNDEQFYGAIKMDGELEKRVGGIYMTAMGCILMHELTHFYKDHSIRVATIDRRELEQEADDMAFDALLSLEGDLYKTSILGGLAAFLSGLYRNPQLAPSSRYYREDIRLFRQYDKIVKEKRRAIIFVAYVLKDWLERFHNIKVEVNNGSEEEAVEEIRSILNGL